MSNRQIIFQKECIRCSQNTDTYKSAFYSSGDALQLLSREKTILDANAPFARLSKYERQELVSMPFDTLFPNLSDHEELLSPKRLTRDCPLFTFKTRLQTKNRLNIPVEIAVSPVPDSCRNGPVFQAHISDISKSRTEEYATDSTSDRLRSIGALAGGIAHNFNNIMTGLYGNITLAKMELSEETEAIAHLEKAENSMEEAVKLTRQLLTFAKGGEPIKETFDPSELIQGTAAFNLSGSPVRLDIDIHAPLWSIHADKEQIGQVVANIVTNARESMKKGGALTIELENTTLLKDNLLTIARGAYLKLVFRDKGDGIHQTDLDRIFDPYFTTKPDGKGMGLSICYSIVNKHKGHISVVSQLGTGTVVTIYLPAEPPETPEEVTMTTDNSTSENKARILVMDDEEHIRSITRKMLEKFGYTVVLTSDGEEAVEEYGRAAEQGNPYNLVIMDLTIPGGMGGKEASTEILAMDPSARIVVSSGYSNDPVMADYKAYGLKGIIPKPYRLTELQETIRNLIA
ncbi:MAG: response regulator [Desulfobacterales bacterium]|nr:response regulator [Desulfobacterales bacterium]